MPKWLVITPPTLYHPWYMQNKLRLLSLLFNKNLKHETSHFSLPLTHKTTTTCVAKFQNFPSHNTRVCPFLSQAHNINVMQKLLLQHLSKNLWWSPSQYITWNITTTSSTTPHHSPMKTHACTKLEQNHSCTKYQKSTINSPQQHQFQSSNNFTISSLELKVSKSQILVWGSWG
jgi:hypothetical protein